MRSRSVVAVVVAAALLLAAGCGSSPSPSSSAPKSATSYPLTVQNCGRSVIFDKPPNRVFTIASDAAVGVAAAGAANRIVSRSGEGGAPLGLYQALVSDVPKVSDNATPSAETVIGTQPDVVVGYDVIQRLGPQLEASGVKLLVASWRCGGNAGTTSGTTFDSLYDQINQFGQVFDTSQAAAKTVADLRRRQEAVQQRFANLPKRTGAVLYINKDYLGAYGGPSFSTTILNALGLSNVFSDLNHQFAQIGKEDLVGRKPDVIVVTYGGSGATVGSDDAAVQTLRSLPGVDTLDAVKSNRLLPINFTYVVGSPLAVDGLEKLGTDLENKP